VVPFGGFVVDRKVLRGGDPPPATAAR